MSKGMHYCNASVFRRMQKLCWPYSENALFRSRAANSATYGSATSKQRCGLGGALPLNAVNRMTGLSLSLIDSE
jgi:hypothetical protein